MLVKLNGITMNVDMGGIGEQHITLIHGVGSNLHSWNEFIAGLGDSFSFLRYDLRGHGHSGKPPGPYTLQDFVDDLDALLSHFHINTTSLIGFSFGGIIGQAFVLAHPDKVNKLVLISTVAGRTLEERQSVHARLAMLESGGVASTIDAAIERWFTPEFRRAHPDLVERRRQQMFTNDPQAYAAAYRVFAESDLLDRLHEIRVPTLIITGQRDAGSTPEMALKMYQRIPDSCVLILPRLRHALLNEAPALLAELVRLFLLHE